MNYQNELEFTKSLIKKAGQLAQFMQKKAKSEFKTHNDVVTEADLALEKLIVEAIQREFPGDQIIAEENHQNPLTKKRTWVIDPIDGTVNYSRGIPLYGVSIGLMVEKRTQAGCIYLPETDELFWASEGGGAFCNKEEISVSHADQLNKSVIHVGDSYSSTVFGEGSCRIQEFLKINTEVMRTRLIGSAVVEAMYVASGKIDAYLCDAFLWDFAASQLIIKEAGGRTTRLNGKPYDPEKRDMVFSNGKLHEEILSLIHKN